MSTSIKTSDQDIGDLVGRIFALSSYRASFSAASALMNSDDADARATAQSMMQWVVAGTGSAARTTAKTFEAWNDLHDQALPLLIQLNVGQGTTYVPALSSKYYKSEVTLLFDALDSYNTQVNTLANTQDVAATVAKIGGGLADVAKTELVPLDAQIASLSKNITDLTVGINTLDLQFERQAISLSASWAKVEQAVTDKQIKDWFNACFKMAIQGIQLANSAMSLSSSMKKPAAAPSNDEPQWNDNPLYDDSDANNWVVNPMYDGGDADDGNGGDAAAGDDAKKPKPGAGIGETKKVVTGAIGLLSTAFGAIQALLSDPAAGARDLLKQAQALVTMQSQLLENFIVSTGNAQALGVSDEITAFELDPAMVWNNYITEAASQLKQVGVGATAGYLAELTALANYGKAMAAKVATAAGQRSQLRAAVAQRSATASVAQRWQALESHATSDAERQAALVGVLEGRKDSIQRSVFVAWEKYRNAYYYLYFQQPPVSLNLDMDVAALRTAFANTAGWVAKLAGDDPSGGGIHLPNENVKISFEFPIAASTGSDSSIETALYSPAADSTPATLTWAIPIGTNQLVGVLPNQGRAAIWITEATFTIEGATPNDKGNIVSQVWTSGSYENGFGPASAHSFVSKPLISNYGYHQDGSAYIPWKIDETVTMTPTPFTQWTMAFYGNGGDAAKATKLHMDLTVSYRRAQ